MAQAEAAAGAASPAASAAARLVAGPDAVRVAHGDLAARLGPAVVVQPMAPPGTEMALGIVNDAQFGPLVVVAAGGTLVEVLADRGAAERSRILVSGFHLPSMDRVLELAPDLATAWLVIGPGADGRTPTGVDPVAAMVAEVADRGHRALHPHHAFVTTELVAAAHDRGVAVNTWTCDDPDRIRWLAGVGVDAVVTNVPDTALTALGRTPSARPTDHPA